ncbi:MAG TPA: NUDIX hydrolase [Candidatus Limnocylindrales bacterium]|nr:NUDIX hydrolase [Candidatus Limnocylindrales bacterium]
MKNNTVNKSKIISSQSAFKSKYFEIDKVTIERNGKKFTKDILSRTPTVIILPVNAKDEIYLVSQFRDSMQERLLEVVAGHMEVGETPLIAAKKELHEETGLTAKTWKQLSTFYVSANMNAVVHIFYATDLTEGKQSLDEDEDIEIVKLPFEEALKKIDKYEIKVSSNIASLLLLDRWRREAASSS